jgi:cytoskeleton protein RodZ
MERETTSGRAVGRLLRDQREARGLSVEDVEKQIRIRHAYIEAIEEGRFDLLPGAAYIPAFLRNYAQHVGLDPEKVLTAYQLSGAVPIKRPVALPADFPAVERRAPVGLAVLTILLVIGAGYGVYRYLPRQTTVVSEKVPPVPDRLLASRPDAPAVTVKPSETLPQQQSNAPAAAVMPAQDTRVTPPVSSMRQETASTPAPPVIVTVPAPPPVVMSVPSAGQAQAAQPAMVDAPREAEQASAPPAVPPTTTPDLTLVQKPMKTDTPLSVRSNSWVELRSPGGDVLAQTYLRAGESYVIPAGIAYRVIDAR